MHAWMEAPTPSSAAKYSFAFQAGEDRIIPKVFPTDQPSGIQPTVSIQPAGSIEPSVSPSQLNDAGEAEAETEANPTTIILLQYSYILL